MSWHLLDGPSKQQRTCWTVPEHLRESLQRAPGPFRRPLVPDPDALLQYVDNAISITEYAQATRYLSPFNGSSLSSSSLSPSPSLSIAYPVQHCDDDLSITPSFPSARKISRFKSASPLSQEYINSLLRHNRQEEAPQALQQPMAAQEHKSMGTDGSTLRLKEGFFEQEGVSREVEKPGKGEVDDACAADDAYRAACCALSEGNAELALSLLYVASAKCPPDKPNALGKVRRLMAAALQLVEKNSAVLRSLPVEKDA